jgi:hypothetical protein
VPVAWADAPFYRVFGAKLFSNCSVFLQEGRLVVSSEAIFSSDLLSLGRRQGKDPATGSAKPRREQFYAKEMITYKLFREVS